AKELILNEKSCSANAVKKIYEKYDELLSQSGSKLINLRRADLKSLAMQLISYIMGMHLPESKVKPNSIVAAEDLSPFEFMKLKENNIIGIVTIKGGPTSHVAILARTYGIPYLIVNDHTILNFENKTCILDCINGSLIIEPNDNHIRLYRTLYNKYSKLMKEFIKYARNPAKTLDGIHVKVECNIGTIEDLRLLDEYGCDGVGLFRVEFIYINKDRPPNEEDLIKTFTKIVNISGEKDIVIRAPDLGADKPVSYLDFEDESNPQLGLRGIRLLLKYKDELLYPFIKAVMIANKHKKLKLLLPMVVSVGEVLEVVKIMNQVIQDLGSSMKNIDIPELGIMIETPATVFIIDQFIEKTPIKFVSIGTNDLTQYILAADRTNPKLSSIYDELHPSVLRALKQLMDRIHQTNRSINVKVCGEMAGQTRALPILLSLGLRELSVAPPFVGKIKYYISNIDLSKIRDTIIKIIETSTTLNEIENYIKAIYKERGLEYFP
ncbi:MAG: phosphoenolpyruvate--protein phosphotransferase, partial [Staphylothermus sp.]|nr:phosphoenolpyruvate--protein phosphotransferase [Staphylothermus sp.]